MEHGEIQLAASLFVIRYSLFGKSVALKLVDDFYDFYDFYDLNGFPVSCELN